MNIDQLLTSLRGRGIHLWKEGNQLRYSANSATLEPDLLMQLREQKQAILEFLGNTQVTGKQQQPILQAVPRSGNLLLSFGQQRLWLLEQLEPNSAVYNIPIGLRLRGPINMPVLHRCLGEILHRHEPLRTRFETVEGQPVQVIRQVASLEVPFVDLSGLPESEREAEAMRLCGKEARQPFDLKHDLMVRAKLFRLGPMDHILFLNMHHIASDGWSIGVLFFELSTLYEAFVEGKPSTLPELTVQYADFAVWQRAYLQGELLERSLSYWRKQLEGAPKRLELPTDRPRPAVQSYRGGVIRGEFPRSLKSALTELSRRERVTLFMTLLAAFQALLHRYTNNAEILVCSPMAGRNRVETERLIGFFVNTLILRGDLSGNPSFRTLLGRTREVAFEAYDHQDLPFEKLVEELHPARDLSQSPFSQVMFVLQNTPGETPKLHGLEVSLVALDTGTSKFDLTFIIKECGGSLETEVKYNADLFDVQTVERMMGHYQTLLEGIASNPELRLSDLPLLSSAERHQLLVEWNQTRLDYPRDKCVHELFEDQVELEPESKALIWGDEHLTYHQLNERAAQLARHLQSLGVGPDTLVGICVERSFEMVVGLLGILKAGGAYVPLDPSYPKERLAFMLEDARPVALVTQRKLQDLLPNHQAQVVYLDAIKKTEAQVGQPHELEPKNCADCLAWVLYTSGSTGQPKGVAIEHRSGVALATWARQVFTKEEFAGVLFSTSICFDLSIFELFVTLANGGTVILAKNALELPGLPAANAVRMINTVPSAIAELVRTAGLPRSIITVNLAGEPLQQSLVDQLYEHQFVRRVLDLYGPTETTTYSTFTLRTKGGRATIGRPISNTSIYILDPYQNPTPIGVPGELHIGGVGLARGYLNRPELTFEKFIPDPFSEEHGARLYKTGDLACYLPNGNIEYLGRLDHQVKIRGFRVELGEIESTLADLPGVREAVVMAREDVPGDKRLVAYLTANAGQKLGASKLRGLLQAKLPEFMVPSAFVILDRLPLTPNGKLDRKALPQHDEDQPAAGFVPPGTAMEVSLAKIWIEVLGLKQVGIHDNFFEIGGHSLLSIRIQSRVERELQLKLPLALFFRAPTLELLARELAAPARADEASRAAVFESTKGGKPLFLFHFHFLAQSLSAHLGPSWSVYCIESRLSDAFHSWQQNGRVGTTLEDLASHCIRTMRTIQPRGPYYLGGFCIGGNLAFEVANQLKKQGEQVALLAFLSAYYHPGMKPAFHYLLTRWRYHFHQAFIRPFGYLSSKIVRKFKGHSNGRSGSQTEQDLDREAFEPEEQRVIQSNMTRRILGSYVGEPVAVRTVLFRGVTDPPPITWKYDPAYGWRNMILGELHFEDVLCGHSQLVDEPWVAEVAKKLQPYLSECEKIPPVPNKKAHDEPVTI